MPGSGPARDSARLTGVRGPFFFEGPPRDGPGSAAGKSGPAAGRESAWAPAFRLRKFSRSRAEAGADSWRERGGRWTAASWPGPGLWTWAGAGADSWREREGRWTAASWPGPGLWTWARGRGGLVAGAWRSVDGRESAWARPMDFENFRGRGPRPGQTRGGSVEVGGRPRVGLGPAYGLGPGPGRTRGGSVKVGGRPRVGLGPAYGLGPGAGADSWRERGGRWNGRESAWARPMDFENFRGRGPRPGQTRGGSVEVGGRPRVGLGPAYGLGPGPGRTRGGSVKVGGEPRVGLGPAYGL